MGDMDNTTPRRIEAGGDNRCTLRLNSWDERAFGFIVTEILDLSLADGRMLDAVERENLTLGATLCCARFDSNDIRAKGEFLRHGYYVAESSCLVSARSSALAGKRYMPFREAGAEHLPSIARIAARDFRHSRFHEDPFIPHALAVRRYENWVTDLVGASKCLVALDEDGEVAGFFSPSVKDGVVDLVLAGMDSERRGYGLFFFQSMMEHVKPMGKTVQAMVSAANIGVLNLYASLGFRFARSFFDYHKLYRPL